MNGDGVAAAAMILSVVGPFLLIVGVVVTLVALARRSRDHDRRLRRLERTVDDDDD